MFHRVMIIDEAHTIKNPKARRTVAMKKIQADCRFALTGKMRVSKYHTIELTFTKVL